MTHDLALLPTQSLVSGVIGAIGVASVIGVAQTRYVWKG